MSDISKAKRQLKIQAGVVSRLWKENGLYRKEQQTNEEKVEKLLADGSDDEWQLKNGRNLVEESKKMVGDTQTRLSAAVAQLRELVVHARSHPGDFEDAEELHAAEAALNESNV